MFTLEPASTDGLAVAYHFAQENLRPAGVSAGESGKVQTLHVAHLALLTSPGISSKDATLVKLARHEACVIVQIAEMSALSGARMSVSLCRWKLEQCLATLETA